jgi:hypothetical protein
MIDHIGKASWQKYRDALYDARMTKPERKAKHNSFISPCIICNPPNAEFCNDCTFKGSNNEQT